MAQRRRDLQNKQGEIRAARRTASPNAGKGMLYPEVELRRQRRKKDVVVLPRLNWTVTSRRRYGGADSGPGKAGTTRSNTGREKKKNNETRSGASWVSLAPGIEG
jgi:hypothetical protein